MRAHWLSTFALVAVAAFAGGVLFSRAVQALDPAWLGLAIAAGVAVALALRRGRGDRR